MWCDFTFEDVLKNKSGHVVRIVLEAVVKVQYIDFTFENVDEK